MEIKTEQLLAEWSCPICTSILRKPLKSCRNGHNMCGECHDRLVKEYEPRSIDPQCPECRISITDTSHNMLAEKTMGYLKVPCPNIEQCGTSISLLEYNDHVEKDCKYATVECKYRSCGCNWTGFNKDSTNHISNCQFILISAKSEEMCSEFKRVTNRLDEMSRRIREIQTVEKRLSETIKIHDSYINAKQRQRIACFFSQQSIVIIRKDDTHYCTTHSFSMFKHNWIVGMERLKSLKEFGLYLRRLEVDDNSEAAPAETHLSVDFKVYTFDTFAESWKKISSSGSQRQIIHKYTNSKPVAVIRKCIGPEHESSVAQSILLTIEAIELSHVKKITAPKRHRRHHHHHGLKI